MTPNELAQQLFKPYKRFTPEPKELNGVCWHEWRVPLRDQPFESPFEFGVFGEFGWRLEGNQEALIVYRHIPRTSFEERVNLLRGEVEEGIE